MLGIPARTSRAALTSVIALFILGAGYWYFVFRPADQIRRGLQLAAAVQVGQTTKSEFRQMAKQYGVDVSEYPNGFMFEQHNSALERVHLAPRMVTRTKVGLNKSVVEYVVVSASMGSEGEFGYIEIDEYDNHKTACGNVPVCVKSRSLNASTIVFFSPSVPISERRHLLSLNWWCLMKFGGCKTSREFFPVAWEKQYQ